MIGIHLFGEVFWFEFPHTLESQEQLLYRLKKEALERSVRNFLEDLSNKGVADIARWEADKILEQYNAKGSPRPFGSEAFNEQFRRELDGEDDIGQRIAYPL